MRVEGLEPGSMVAVWDELTMEEIIPPQKVHGTWVETWADDPKAHVDLLIRVRKVGWYPLEVRSGLRSGGLGTVIHVSQAKDEIF